MKCLDVETDLIDLYSSYGDSAVSRRQFMQRAAALGVASTAASVLSAGFNGDARAAAQSTATQAPIQVREWSYFWLGVKRAELARGTVVGGQQMYVEYQIPAKLKHPYPIVLVHGGGGQGTDWMGTPDGRPGWFQYLLQEGYAVYVVDRPGHGRSPYHPDLHGPFGPAPTLEAMVGFFTPAPPGTTPRNPLQTKHSQWPGQGSLGSADLDQLVAPSGGSYVAGPNAAPLAHAVWRERGAELLDKIGPAIIVTHSAGGPFGLLVADVRPKLVKGLIVIEGVISPFSGGNRWGVTTIPMTYDPPVKDAAELKTVQVAPAEAGSAPYLLQAEPARKLKNLTQIPTVIVTAEASFMSPGNAAAAAFLRQAGCPAEELRLTDAGVHGNGHMMMVECNSREVLQTLLGWIDRKVAAGPAPAASPHAAGTTTALQLADQQIFWVGTEHKAMPYGTILRGQMYVQGLIPATVRQRYPIVLVHGGTGQMLHYMGNPGMAGWAHYYLQAGYMVYLVDRPGHGRAPFHPDALGPISAQPTFEMLTGDTGRSARGPQHRWPGTGEIGDPLLDQLVANQNGTMQDAAAQQSLWASRGAELLDRIGPAIIQTHSAGGAFGWLAADQRPDLVKAIVVFEGGGAPLSAGAPWGLTAAPLAYDPPIASPAELIARDVPATDPGQSPFKLQAEPARKLKNLQNIPMLYLTAENSGRTGGPAVTQYLRQAGVPAEHLNLKERGIMGNGHFAMLETNNKEVFEVIRDWIEHHLPAAG